MSRKDKVVAQPTERFELFFSAVGWGQSGAKHVIKNHRVEWKSAAKQQSKRKAG